MRKSEHDNEWRRLAAKASAIEAKVIKMIREDKSGGLDLLSKGLRAGARKLTEFERHLNSRDERK